MEKQIIIIAAIVVAVILGCVFYAYQKAKNETHSAGEGAKRKDEILKRRDVLEDKIKNK